MQRVHIARKVRGEDVWPSIAIHIRDGNTHRCLRDPFTIERDATAQSILVELQWCLFFEQVVGLRIVAHEDVRLPVAREIEDCEIESVRCARGENLRCSGTIDENTITKVFKQRIRRGAIPVGTTHYFNSLEVRAS